MLEPLLPDRTVARRGGQWLDHLLADAEESLSADS
mgnify:CR=1 FL=1